MTANSIHRRSFLTLLGTSAAAWPLATRAQQDGRVRRIGVLMTGAADDPVAPVLVTALAQGLQQLGWTDGRNLRIDYRWGAGNDDLIRRYASELVALAPDVILAGGGQPARALQQATRTVPIVFVGLFDPVGQGLVASLARPDGNITGFTLLEYGFAAKWLELLKEIAPRVTRVAVLRDSAVIGGIGQWSAIQAVAPSFGVELSPIGMRNAGEIERGVAAFGRSPNGGLIVTRGGSTTAHRELIIMLAARHKLPAVYSGRSLVAAGGLISYAPYADDQPRQAAGYIDRILKGEKPADLPVQMAVKYETVLNMRTAKALGLEVPTSVLLRADEVIE
jgi:putative ABC transport system substrate-binding protein